MASIGSENCPKFWLVALLSTNIQSKTELVLISVWSLSEVFCIPKVLSSSTSIADMLHDKVSSTSALSWDIASSCKEQGN